jgi:DNA polymerase III subunit delta'
VGFQDPVFSATRKPSPICASASAPERFPHSLILAGPAARANTRWPSCSPRPSTASTPLNPTACPTSAALRNCTRIADSANLEALVAEAVAARDDLRETDKRETRILIQTHPDLLIVPPDPPQLLIKLGQVRQVIHVAFYRPPVESKRTFTIFTSSAFMKEAANSLLKVLEEPPEHTSLILLTENPQELLPTIRSRAVDSPPRRAPASDLESLLAPPSRAQAARPRPRRPPRRRRRRPRPHIDLAAYLASRQDALILLRTACASPTTPSSSTPRKATAPAPTARRKPSASSALWAAS